MQYTNQVCNPLTTCPWTIWES